MRAAGYSEAYVKNSYKFKRTKSYAECLDEAGLTDEAMSRAHAELTMMEEHDQIVFPMDRTDAEIKKKIATMRGCSLLSIEKFGTRKVAYIKRPVMMARKAGLDIAMRGRGYYGKENEEETPPQSSMSDEELMAAIAEEKKKIAK